MTSPNTDQGSLAHLGLYGLGTMGSALALNILDKGFALHVSNRSPDRLHAFMAEAEAEDLAAKVQGHDSLTEMADAMAKPRAIILMVQAGEAVDESIDALIPHLSPGDTIIDAGNADFHDTRARTKRVEEAGLAYLGMGVSGGEEGARHGPSIMAGGTPATYDGVRPVIEAIAARFDGTPCAAHLGPDGAGHFVKTVHNGIEYADMQLIAEIYGLMRRGLGRTPDAIGKVFEGWDNSTLKSYLVEITGIILQTKDTATGEPVVDVIVDKAGQKGTGRWTVIEALALGQSASVIEAGVGARGWSAEKAARMDGEKILGTPRGTLALTDAQLESALLAARIAAYAQGFRLLAAASDNYNWSLDPARIAEIWRAGCIIRSALLDNISAAFRAAGGDAAALPHGQLIFAPAFAALLQANLPGLRQVVSAAIGAGYPVPALSAAIGWFDSMATGRGTTDLIQAQRDFFGRHGFDRIDGAKAQHGPWAG